MKPGEQARPSGPAPALAEAEILSTRASLLSRLKDLENQSSWQEFFDTYWRLVYSTARQAGLTPEEAQDVVQDTFVAVAKHIGEFRYDPARCSFKSWLRLITGQRIIWQWRKRPPLAPRSAPSDDADRTTALDRIPDPQSLDLNAVWDGEWRKSLLFLAVERIKPQIAPRQFQIFDLYVFQNWPVRDVARTLGVSVARVYLAKHRVGALLKREVARLEREGG